MVTQGFVVDVEVVVVVGALTQAGSWSDTGAPLPTAALSGLAPEA